MAKKADADDAKLVLRLYDMRREAEMRKARAWYAGSFWPKNADDYIKIATAFSIPENAWLRQVLSYWDMCAALVLHGTINEALYADTCGEMWFMFSKISPFIKEVRTKMETPELLLRVEKVATGTKVGKDRLKKMEARMKAWGETFAGPERT